jgi:fucose permease
MLIAAAILAILVYGIIAAMLGTLMPTFGFSGDQNGTIALAQALGLVIASLSAGPLIDNRGKKIALVLGLALICGVLWLLPSASGFEMVAALLFVLGLGGGIIVTGANTLVSDIAESSRSATLNLMNLFFGLGGMITPLVFTYALGQNAKNLCYLAAGLATVTFLIHATSKVPGPTGERGFKLSEAGQVLGRPALWLLSAFLFLYVACEVGVFNWLAAYLISVGVPKEDAPKILGWGFAGGLLVGRVVVSRILGKIAPPTVTLAASVLMAITTFVMLKASSDTTTAALAVFCAGLAMAPVFPTTLGMVGDAFPKATATAMGIVITCGWLGLAVSSPIIGSIAGSDSKNLSSALLLIPAFAAVMVVVNLALRPALKK